MFGFEGLLRRVMYVFDDATVFVEPPPSVMAADALRLGLAKAKAARVPTFGGEGVVKALSGQYVNRRKFHDIVEFSHQFGEAGFSDPRITSTMLAEQLERTERIPHREIASVQFVFHPAMLPPHVAVKFTRVDAASSSFRMRYHLEKVHEAREVLAAVLGSRVAALSPP